jgi:hypothetical protein
MNKQGEKKSFFIDEEKQLVNHSFTFGKMLMLAIARNQAHFDIM